ncbi:MAG: ABC transporter ATP-binding protein [Clostridia bacterium]
MDILKRIFSLMGRYKKRTALAAALLIIVIITRLVYPYLTKIVTDEIIQGGKTELLPGIIVLILLLTVVRATAVYTRAYLFENISQSIIFDLRCQLYTHLQTLPFKFYDENRIGEIMSRMTGDVEGIRNFLAGGAITMLENFIYFIGAITILFSLNYKLALVVLAVAPFLAIAARRFDKVIRPAFGEIREQNAVLNTRAQENIAGARVVKAFAREDYEKDYFSKENLKHLEKNIKVTYTWSKFYPAIEFISQLSPILLLWFGGRMVVRQEISLGTLIAFTGYIWMITGPMRMVGWLVNMVAQAISSGEKIFYYLDLGPAIKDKEGAGFPKDFKGHVRFENVSFKYADNLVLEDISFDVAPGKTLAIMGATGSGKTSIVNLIGRFYECSKGRVMIDGMDVKDMKLKELRRHIGFVMQETFLFSETIAANIAFGKPDATMDEIIEAAKIAQAHDFIMEMSDQYETVVGERGMGLSGGQKQRVAIARALLKNPTILILDDSTSSVDMETEFEIQKGLEKVMKDRTTFIIAHRISSVKDADEIIVLDDKRIAERGTHQSLMEKKGLYYQMYMDQYKDFEEINTGKQVV